MNIVYLPYHANGMFAGFLSFVRFVEIVFYVVFLAMFHFGVLMNLFADESKLLAHEWNALTLVRFYLACMWFEIGFVCAYIIGNYTAHSNVESGAFKKIIAAQTKTFHINLVYPDDIAFSRIPIEKDESEKKIIIHSIFCILFSAHVWMAILRDFICY